MTSIKENTEKVLENVRKACVEAGRDPSGVEVLAAAKYTDRSGIRELIKSGIRLIGENRIQDATEKLCADEKTGQLDIHDEFENVKIHFIGHLQKNKINHALKFVDMIETIDSISLADNIDKRVGPAKEILPALVEVKLTVEESKTGCSENDIEVLLNHIWSNCPHIELQGLMGMGPWDPDPETARPYYVKLRKVFDKYCQQAPDPEIFNTVSMGMSADYHIAIQEGATVVRIGRALFV